MYCKTKADVPTKRIIKHKKYIAILKDEAINYADKNLFSDSLGFAEQMRLTWIELIQFNTRTRSAATCS